MGRTCLRDEEGAMKKYAAIALTVFILLLGFWSNVYRPYLEAQNSVARACISGNHAEAMELIDEYRTSWSWYIMDNVPLFERFRLRLIYNEGVVSGMLGDQSSSEESFQASAQSTEKEIAAPSFYNLAHLAIQRGQLELGRSLLSKSLSFEPHDIQAKANLELVIRRLRREGLDQR
jgi:hypothetical protein